MGKGLSDKEFLLFKNLIYSIAGISISQSKKAMVSGRLGKRLEQHRFGSYRDYFNFITSEGQADELQLAVDLLTTNETFFFREAQHFTFMQQVILPPWRRDRNFRAWSAACSTGEEPYAMAMVLSEVLGTGPWEVIASDLSLRVLRRAQRAIYAIEAHRGAIPNEYLKRYCLKGIGSEQGTLMVSAALRERVRFRQINLNRTLPEIGKFHLIFLRNVMIYFDLDTKRRVLERVIDCLEPGGHLFVGHSETINGIVSGISTVAPAIYRKD